MAGRIFLVKDILRAFISRIIIGQFVKKNDLVKNNNNFRCPNWRASQNSILNDIDSTIGLWIGFLIKKIKVQNCIVLNGPGFVCSAARNFHFLQLLGKFGSIVDNAVVVVFFFARLFHRSKWNKTRPAKKMKMTDQWTKLG